jgi:hypothetical protein
MACQFSIQFSGSAEAILQKAKQAVTAQGGSFDGDLNTGNFDVSLLSNRVAGSYIVSNQQLDLTITEKPMFIPCNAIESFLISKLT